MKLHAVVALSAARLMSIVPVPTCDQTLLEVEDSRS